MDLKTKVDSVGRKAVAKELGWSYSMLSHRLNGFLPITEEQKIQIVAAVKRIKEANCGIQN